MSRIVIVGGAGFIGTRLVAQLLAAGHGVTIVDREGEAPEGASFVQCDVRDRPALEAACAGAEVLIHLAAEHRDDVHPVSLYDEVNVEGTRNLCEVADAVGCSRVIFTSSVAVYGFKDFAADENADPCPFNDYGRTKLEAEKVLQAWANEGTDRALVIVRPTVVFGEGNRGNVYNLIRQIAVGPFLMVGDGRNCKSMAYVDNVASFLHFALGFDVGTHIYNYVDRPDLDVNGLVQLIRSELGQEGGSRLRLPKMLGLIAGGCLDLVGRLLGRSMPISAVRVRKFVSSSVFSAEKATAAGFQPEVPLEAALRRTIQHEFGRN